MSKKIGRPTGFTPEVLEYILGEITRGRSERSIFNDTGLPFDLPCWRAWGKYKREHPEFIPHYALAKEQCYEVWEHEMVETALDDSRDYQTDAKGNIRSDNTSVNRDRLIIDTKKWIMSRLMSKKYGDKVTQELTGAEGAPFVPVINIKVEK